jgi:hypothetical protein
MTFHQFQDFVAANMDWFRGRLPETDSSLRAVEETLGVQLPGSLKWLVKEHGYWHGTAVSNLQDAVKDTLNARHDLALPNKYVVLENLQDAGIILIDTGAVNSSGESPLYWVGMQDLGNPPRLDDNTRYESFGDYVRDRLPSVQDAIEASQVCYDPMHFPEGRDKG